MRYLVTRYNENGTKSKLARFAFNSDASRFATSTSKEPHTEKIEVLDTKLKLHLGVAVNGVYMYGFKPCDGSAMYK